MKNLLKILILTLTFVLVSCNSKGFDERVIEYYNPTLDVTITEVNRAKHSSVEGYATFNGIKYYVTNNSSGYYYKEYSIKPGDVIQADVTIYFLRENNGDIRITNSGIDVSKYETN